MFRVKLLILMISLVLVENYLDLKESGVRSIVKKLDIKNSKKMI